MFVGGLSPLNTLSARTSLPGVKSVAAADSVGPGVGQLAYQRVGTDHQFRWRPPGLDSFGEWATVAENSATCRHAAEFRVLTVSVQPEELPVSAQTSPVYVRQRYDSQLVIPLGAGEPADVSAEEAATGVVRTWELPLTLYTEAVPLRFWLGGGTRQPGWHGLFEVLWMIGRPPSASTFELSLDGDTWSSPTDYASGLEFVAPPTPHTLWVRETVPPGAAANPRAVFELNWGYLDDGTLHVGSATGLYRIFNAPEYRFYRETSGPPAEGSAPFDTATSLPHEPEATYADGTWYVACSYFDGLIDSGFLPVGPRGEPYHRLDLDGGVVVLAPPEPPREVALAQRGGAPVVTAVYDQTDDGRATQWAIAVTTDGSTPPADAPDLVVDLPATGLAVLDRDLGSLVGELFDEVVTVRVQVRRNDGTSESPSWRYSSSVLAAITIASWPPSPVYGGGAWPGRTATGITT